MNREVILKTMKNRLKNLMTEEEIEEIDMSLVGLKDAISPSKVKFANGNVTTIAPSKLPKSTTKSDIENLVDSIREKLKPMMSDDELKEIDDILAELMEIFSDIPLEGYSNPQEIQSTDTTITFRNSSGVAQTAQIDTFEIQDNLQKQVMGKDE